LTFTKTLVKYFQKSCEEEFPIAAQHIHKSRDWFMNRAEKKQEIIVDEAQDLEAEYYTSLKKYAPVISYGSDDSQHLYNEQFSSEEDLKKIFPENKHFQLRENFRNTRRILNFAFHAFPEANIKYKVVESCKEEGVMPRFFYRTDTYLRNKDLIELLQSLLANSGTMNIAILTPLGVSKPEWYEYTSTYYSNLLSGKFELSHYHHKMEGDCPEIKNIHITPFKSAKGLEFDTVIVPCFEALEEEFDVVSRNDFYVGVTRAKSNLFLFSKLDMHDIHHVVENA